MELARFSILLKIQDRVKVFKAQYFLYRGPIGGDTAHQKRLPKVIGSVRKKMGCGWVAGWVGGFMRIMPRWGSILQSGTCQLLQEGAERGKSQSYSSSPPTEIEDPTSSLSMYSVVSDIVGLAWDGNLSFQATSFLYHFILVIEHPQSI